ncbi:MAG: acetylxylan esterase [Planctomycetia bacterium]|nr:acetylxylan esterase [Planctomycetia bacterium]
MSPRRRLLAFVLLTAGSILLVSPAVGEQAAGLAAQLKELNAAVVPADSEQGKELPKMLSTDARNRIRAANQRETKAWQELKNKADWEKFKEPRIAALRASLGQALEAPKDLKVRVTKTLEGDGYKIENLVFESRPGLLVTANLYLPKEAGKSMPGIVICSSHHNPKTQAELQDMGMTWARHGCMVIVPDNLGHGERRAHPFVDANSYASKFAVSRQDYWFRYNTAMQLHLAGESLIGWMAWDLSRCVDVLLSRPGVDKDRIVLLGSVAGGGDPVAVTAALDPRIACVVPYNFGGPQPETVFPLPDDAELAFNYAGGGSWESTRNLRLSARDGFMPWVIVGSVVPRKIIHAHEFAWDQERDPVYKRYEKLYAWYGVSDGLSSAKGRGTVKGKAPESTHCNNIGFEHRKELHPTLNRWFKLGAKTESEFQDRRQSSDLLCLTPETRQQFGYKHLYEVAGALGAERASAARQQLAKLPPEARIQKLRADWAKLLGDVDVKEAPKAAAPQMQKLGDVTVEKLLLQVEPDVVVPAVLLLPNRKGKVPVVVAFAQEGKQAFLKQRAEEIAELLAAGTAVCLPDLRGCGETKIGGDSRGRTSASSSVAASELMLGRTLLGLKLKDLRAVLAYLRTRPEVDAKQLALWGDSFAAPNGDAVKLDVPWDAEKLPAQSEPLGGLLALLGALSEPDVKATYGQGGLSGYQAVLQSHFCYVPSDAIVPGALTTGDLCDVAAALAPRAVRLQGLVDGTNRPVSAAVLAKVYEPTRSAYTAAKVGDRLSVGEDKTKPTAWLLGQLK